MKKLVIPGLMISLTLLSCQKEPNDNTCTTNMTTIAGSYKLTSMKYKANSTAAESDITNTVDACQADDVVTYNANGTYNYQDAGTVCSPAGTHSAGWSLSGNMLTVNGDVVKIENFDCKNLALSQTDFYIPGDKIIVTYTKQ